MTHEHRHLLAKVMAEGFALDDALLFLDTHPDDEAALSYYQEPTGLPCSNMRRRARRCAWTRCLLPRVISGRVRPGPGKRRREHVAI